MIDLVQALRNRATWETATGITEPHQHIDWMAAEEITRLREENARLREALKVAADFLDDAYTDIGRDEYKVAGFVARAAIREGGKDDVS